MLRGDARERRFNGGVAMRAFGLAGKWLSDETTNLKAHRT